MTKVSEKGFVLNTPQFILTFHLRLKSAGVLSYSTTPPSPINRQCIHRFQVKFETRRAAVEARR